jgi:hypothetical protein
MTRPARLGLAAAGATNVVLARLTIDHTARGKLGFRLAFVQVAFVLVHRHPADGTTTSKSRVAGARDQRTRLTTTVAALRCIGMCHYNKSFSTLFFVSRGAGGSLTGIFGAWSFTSLTFP